MASSNSEKNKVELFHVIIVIITMLVNHEHFRLREISWIWKKKKKNSQKTGGQGRSNKKIVARGNKNRTFLG